MRKLTEEEALTIICPKSFNKEWIFNCKGSKCFAWEEVDSRIEREDHSDAKKSMMYIETLRHQEITRRGPHGCNGTLILEARGTCRLIYPETERKEKRI